MVCSVLAIYAVFQGGVEMAPAAADYELELGCIDTQPTRRCFTLYKTEWTWTEAATLCSEVTGRRLAVIDRQCHFT